MPLFVEVAPGDHGPTTAPQTQLLLFDGLDELDAVGPFEVLVAAGFPVRTVVPPGSSRQVQGANGLVLTADAPPGGAARAAGRARGWVAGRGRRRPQRGGGRGGAAPPGRLARRGDGAGGGPLAGVDLPIRLVERWFGNRVAVAPAARLEHVRVGPLVVAGAADREDVPIQ